MKNFFRLAFLMAITAALAIPANAAEEQGATDEASELAKKLANPIASLMSVPLQYNYDEYGGLNDGASASRLLIQPVIPVSPPHLIGARADILAFF